MQIDLDEFVCRDSLSDKDSMKFFSEQMTYWIKVMKDNQCALKMPIPVMSKKKIIVEYKLKNNVNEKAAEENL